MNKISALGALIGVVLGIVLNLLLPATLYIEAVARASFRRHAGLPYYPGFRSGSVYTVGVLLPSLLGIAGGVVGLLLSKKKEASKR